MGKKKRNHNENIMVSFLIKLYEKDLFQEQVFGIIIL